MGLRFTGASLKGRRIAVLSIEADRFLDFLRRCGDGQPHVLARVIPDDARVVGLTVDAVFNTVQFHVESASFPELPPNRMPDEWDVTFTEAQSGRGGAG